MVMVAVVIITGGVMVIIMAVVKTAAVVITPGKAPEKTPRNPSHKEKGESPWGSQCKKEYK